VTRFPKNKRQRIEGEGEGFRGKGRGRGRGSRGRERGGVQRSLVYERKEYKDEEQTVNTTKNSVEEPTASLAAEAKPESHLEGDTSMLVDHESSGDSDGEPEVISSKPSAQLLSQMDAGEDTQVAVDQPISLVPPSRPIPTRKGPIHQPRKPLRNPFAERPSLLRNLLLPEIRMTVSNLSQAIRFLVDNDLLENVELKPGQATERMIEVIDSPAEFSGSTDEEAEVQKS